MAGPFTSVCYTATLKAAQGSGWVEAGLLSRDWDTTRFVPFVSFTNSGQGSKLHKRKWSKTIINFIYQNNSVLKTEKVSVYPVTTQEKLSQGTQNEVTHLAFEVTEFFSWTVTDKQINEKVAMLLFLMILHNTSGYIHCTEACLLA